MEAFVRAIDNSAIDCEMEISRTMGGIDSVTEIREVNLISSHAIKSEFCGEFRRLL